MESLKLYYPVRPYVINQRFGDNMPCVKDFGLASQTIIMGSNSPTCPVGYEKLYAKFGMSGHNGMDLDAGEQNVYAAHDGVVVELQDVPARGLGIGILTNEQVMLRDYGIHFAKTRYWHLKRFYVSVGDKVTAGQLIAVTNTTGYSSGNHLHFELQPMDKDAGGHPILAFPDNGIGAAIDPEPFFTGVYADTVPQTISLLRQALIILNAIVAELLKKQ